MQFFQFYLAATVLTVIPIAADLHNRQKLNRSLRRSETEFRLLAEHCTDVIMRISVDGRILLARIHAAQGKEKKALEELKAALDVAPTHAVALRMAVEIHARCGEADAASILLREALADQPQNDAIRAIGSELGIPLPPPPRPVVVEPPVAPPVAPAPPTALPGAPCEPLAVPPSPAVASLPLSVLLSTVRVPVL